MSSLSPRSPNSWVLVASLLAVVGMPAFVVGSATHASWLRITGMVLMAPVVFGGIGLMLVVIPILIVANCRGGKDRM